MITDPLEEFFARERADIRELPGGPDHWEGIVREARRPVRRWPAYLGAAAAVAAVAAVGYAAFGPLRSHDDLTVATTGPKVSASVTTSSTGSASPSGGATGIVPPAGTATTPSALPAPLTFSAISFSNAGGGHLFSLGSAHCASAPCVAVVASDDDGRTWTTRSSFPALTALQARRTPEAPNQLVGLRFATPEVGYAYGSKTFRTTDGGRSWKVFDVGGRQVLSLETDGKQVWLVTAGSCRHGTTPGTRGCTDVQVWSAPTTASNAGPVPAVRLPSTVEAAWLSMDGSDAYLSVSFSDDTQSLPMRVSGTPQALPRPQGCATNGGVWVWGTADRRKSLVALCRAGSAGSSGSYAVAASADSGATWTTAAPAPALGAPGAAGVWLTAADPSHLVALTGALPTSASTPDQPTALLSSTDGGASWAAAQVDQPSQAWSWVGAAGGRLVYLLGGSAGTYAVSSDSGATFSARSFRP